MANLIEELKNEHKIIGEILSRVREMGIGSKEAQELLISAKEQLLAHLKKEDSQLYPILRKKAISDERLQNTLEFFAKDMEPISEAVMSFFWKYSKGVSGLDFAREFGRLFITLTGRIKKEEDILYREYEKLS